jgi:hypothetical protein
LQRDFTIQGLVDAAHETETRAYYGHSYVEGDVIFGMILYRKELRYRTSTP